MSSSELPPSDSPISDYEASLTNQSQGAEYSFGRPDEAQIEAIREHIQQQLEMLAIDAGRVVFAGYNPQIEKTEGGEHWPDDEKPHYYFGTWQSTSASETFGGDDEEAGERWSVNPLKYALEGGVLGVYDRAILDALNGGTPTEYDEEYGTILYTGIEPDQVNAARLAEITIGS